MAAALIFVSESLFRALSTVNINFLSDFMGELTRPKETENLNGVFYLLFVVVFKTSVYLIILSDKFSLLCLQLSYSNIYLYRRYFFL